MYLTTEMETDELITRDKIKILDRLLSVKIETDDDLIALGEIFEEDEYNEDCQEI